MTAGSQTHTLSVADLRLDPRRRRRERTIHWLFMGAAALSIVISAAIVLSLIGNAASFALRVDPGALWTEGWFPRRGLYDIRTLLAGTLIIAGVAMLIAAPLGIGAAIYLSEYARPRTRSLLKPVSPRARSIGISRTRKRCSSNSSPTG